MAESWYEQIGSQRDWIWRGWQIRYSYLKSPQSTNNPPLVFLHGFGAAIEHWRHNLGVLSKHCPVYALDLLGFGASRKARVDYNVELWVEQIHDFWQTFINQPVILVGNSLGSLVSVVAADQYPEMTQGLVLLTIPDVSLRQQVMPKWLLPLVTGLENLVASPPLLRLLFQLLRQPRLIELWLGVAYHNRQAITQELVGIISAPPQDLDAASTFISLFQNVRKPTFAPSLAPIIARLELPILLVWGLRDRMIPPGLGAIFAELNPKIELIELENVGHCPHDESFAQFNQLLLTWLGNL